jgi:hypothetical protein
VLFVAPVVSISAKAEVIERPTPRSHGTIAALSGELTLDWLIEAVDHGGGGVRRGARAARTSDELDRMAPPLFADTIRKSLWA